MKSSFSTAWWGSFYKTKNKISWQNVILSHPCRGWNTFLKPWRILSMFWLKPQLQYTIYIIIPYNFGCLCPHLCLCKGEWWLVEMIFQCSAKKRDFNHEIRLRSNISNTSNIFNNLEVFEYPDETLFRVFDIASQTNQYLKRKLRWKLS